MGDWNFLRRLLQYTQKYPTVTGNVWLMALFIFRILVLGAANQGVWADEHSEFICNTQQPGCKHACFDAIFSFSHIHFWMFQIIAVSMPTFIYLAYVFHVILLEDQKVNKGKMKETQNGRGASFRTWSEADGSECSDKKPLAQKKERLSIFSEHDKICVAGHLLKIYIGSIVFKIMIELAFIVGQVYLYGFRFLPHYVCSEVPCPNRVDCSASRSKEKTVFMLFMLTMACVSLLLNMLEICSLGLKMFNWRAKSPIFAQLFPVVERKAFTEDGGVTGDLQLEMSVAESDHDLQAQQ